MTRLRKFAVGGFLAAIGLQIVTILSLMVTTKLRKILRGKRSPHFPALAPERVAIGDNQTVVYTWGEHLFDAMISAIDGAQRRVLFESYIIKSDAVGQRFKNALESAAARGVDVYVVYDGFANLVVPRSFFKFDPRIHVMKYPLWAAGWRFFSIRRMGRDHRKILAVDGHDAFIGGYNVGQDYATVWRDTHLRITGPAAWDLDNAFVDFWNMHHQGRQLTEDGTPMWDPVFRLHRNVPGQLRFPIRGMYLEAIDRAQSHILMTQAYFIPDRDILQALRVARKRGVQVSILVPAVSNHVVADWLSRGFYDELLSDGIQILWYHGRMVHAKTATIDGQWTTIGTANIDRLSLTGNYEINMEVFDPQLARAMERIFEFDSTHAAPVNFYDWNRRGLGERVSERILRPLRPLL